MNKESPTSEPVTELLRPELPLMLDTVYCQVTKDRTCVKINDLLIHRTDLDALREWLARVTP